MKILINTATTYKGGSVQVALSFIQECKKNKEHEYHVVLGDNFSTIVNCDSYPDNFYFYSIGYRPAERVFSLKSRVGFFRDLEDSINPDVVFTTTGPAYWRPSVPHLVSYNLPHYVYPGSPYFSKISFLKRLKWKLKGRVLKYFFSKEADAFVVQTDDVNRRLRDWLNTEKAYTVSNTFSGYYERPKVVPNKLPERDIGDFRFLSLSSWYPHKNLDIIPKVVDHLPDRLKTKIKFVVTLPDNIYKEHFPKVNSENIINVGPVKPEEGPALYQECDALFLPTLLECFSASYAEAMKMDKPIVTTDLGFAKSICGKAALYYKPVDAVDAARKIEILVEDEHLRQEMIQMGRLQLQEFDTPSERAEKYLELCEALMEGRRPKI